MFANAVPLSSADHRDLRYTKLRDFSFSADVISAPLTHTEMFQAAKYYPLLLPAQGPPVALLGVRGCNHFVAADGHWTVSYLPAHIGRYPFILGASEQSTSEMHVMVVPDAPHFKTDAGERLFDEDGNETTALSGIKKFLKLYQEEAVQSERFTRQLFDADVLVEQEIQKRQGEQLQILLREFYVVDRKKFDALDDATILAWRKNGTLPLVYAHLLSLSNLPNLARDESAGSS